MRAAPRCSPSFFISASMKIDLHKVNNSRDKLLNPLLLRLYLLRSLPAAWFVGIRLRCLTSDASVVVLHYSWWNRNPFRSIYFTALLAAGEFASGVIAAILLQGYRQKISMLVSHVEAEFVKKATGICTFTCTDGQALLRCIQAAVDSGAAQKLVCTTEARNEKDELVAVIKVIWSFKLK